MKTKRNFKALIFLLIIITSILLYSMRGYLQLIYIVALARNEATKSYHLKTDTDQYTGKSRARIHVNSGTSIRQHWKEFDIFTTKVIYTKQGNTIDVQAIYDSNKVLTKADNNRYYLVHTTYTPDLKLLSFNPQNTNGCTTDEYDNLVILNGRTNKKSYVVNLYDSQIELTGDFNPPLTPLICTSYLRDANDQVYHLEVSVSDFTDLRVKFSKVQGLHYQDISYLKTSSGKDSLYFSDGQRLFYAHTNKEKVPLATKSSRFDKFVVPQNDKFGIFAIHEVTTLLQPVHEKQQEQSDTTTDFRESALFYYGQKIENILLKTFEIDQEVDPSNKDYSDTRDIFHDKSSIYCGTTKVIPAEKPLFTDITIQRIDKIPTNDTTKQKSNKATYQVIDSQGKILYKFMCTRYSAEKIN